jgi:ubiquinone/menaquinone biosynthesis C-methylase UbiE
MKWLGLRKSGGESLAISMAGVKLGDRLVIVGCADPVLIARLAVKTGLTGRAYAVDDQQQAVTRAAEIALREGALIESAVASFAALPLDRGTFDVAVVRDVVPRIDAELRLPCLAEVRRVLRPGGRCLVIDSAPRGLGALMHAAAATDYVALFAGAGFRAARVLAEREGLVFAEGVNPISNP